MVNMHFHWQSHFAIHRQVMVRKLTCSAYTIQNKVANYITLLPKTAASYCYGSYLHYLLITPEQTQ